MLLTPLPADRATSPLPAAALEERNRVLSQYSEAIRSLAASRQLASIDIYTAMLGAMTRSHPEPLFEKGMHLTDAGYGVAAAHIASSSVNPRDARFAPLRSLIVQKNEAVLSSMAPGERDVPLFVPPA